MDYPEFNIFLLNSLLLEMEDTFKYGRLAKILDT